MWRENSFAGWKDYKSDGKLCNSYLTCGNRWNKVVSGEMLFVVVILSPATRSERAHVLKQTEAAVLSGVLIPPNIINTRTCIVFSKVCEVQTSESESGFIGQVSL